MVLEDFNIPASMTTTREVWHILDLILYTGQGEGDLVVEELLINLLSWTDHDLIRAQVHWDSEPPGTGDQLKCSVPRGRWIRLAF